MWVIVCHILVYILCVLTFFSYFIPLISLLLLKQVLCVVTLVVLTSYGTSKISNASDFFSYLKEVCIKKKKKSLNHIHTESSPLQIYLNSNTVPKISQHLYIDDLSWKEGGKRQYTKRGESFLINTSFTFVKK